MSTDDRSWMYNRRLPNRSGITDEFIRDLKSFIEFSLANPKYMSGNNIRCPCDDCKNRKYFPSMIVEKHLLQHGFQVGYKRWVAHGEQIRVVTRPESNQKRIPVREPEPVNTSVNDEPVRGMEDMVRDVAGAHFDWSENARQEEPKIG